MRWLIEPLSVISPTSSEGGVVEQDRAHDAVGRAGGLPARSRRAGERNSRRTPSCATISAALASLAGPAPGGGRPRGREKSARRCRRGPRRRSPRPSHTARRCAMKRARSGPTLTQVPVASLKSSAMRPSNKRPLLGSCRSSNLQRIAEPVEAFLVEGFGGQLRLAPVARRDVRPSQRAPRSCRRAGTSLTSMPGGGRPMLVAFCGVPHAAEREGRGLGRAEAGEEQDVLAAGAVRQLLHLVEHLLGERRAGEPQHLQAAEEVLAQRRVGAEEGQQRLVALRHREIPGRRDLAQVRAPSPRSRRAAACRRRCRSCRHCGAPTRHRGCRRRCDATAPSRRSPAARP